MDKIREGIAECFYYYRGWDGETKWGDVSKEDREGCYDFADASIRKLHSQGVVRKVNRAEKEAMMKAGGIPLEALREFHRAEEAGYVAVEPLIGDDNEI